MFEYERIPYWYRQREGRLLLIRRSFPETLVLSFMAQLLDPKLSDEERIIRLGLINRFLLGILRGVFATNKEYRAVFFECMRDVWRDMFPKLLFPADEEVRERLVWLPDYLRQYLKEHWDEWSGYDCFVEGYKQMIEERVQWLIFDTVVAFMVRVGLLSLEG